MQLMPSPSSIPRSSSDPTLCKTLCSHSHLPSNHSACSAGSTKSSSWSSKVARLVGGKSQSSRHSYLQEENLEAHNKRNAIFDDTYSNPSSYYKELTDSSPETKRPTLSLGLSPERKSDATTIATSSSLSTFIFRMRELSTSCFSVKSKRDDSQPAAHATMKAGRSPLVSSSPPSASSSKTKGTVLKEMSRMSEERKEMGKINALLDKEKLLRERVPKPALITPTVILPSKDQVINEKDSNEELKESEFIWANKYQPKALEDFICNREKAIELRALIREGGCGHIIFEGPPGVGKRTMIWAMLQESFGPDRIQARDECKAFNLKGEMIRKIQVHVKQSPQHVEVNLSELKGYEKHVVVELIKETQNMISNKALSCDSDNCRAIILYEADKLSTDALLYIRWLLERYKGCNKVFFCCSDLSKLQPIKTLCTVVQLVPPSNKEIVEVLEFIAKQEGIELPHRLAEKIAEKSKNNLRQAIRSFEASWKNNYPFKEDQEILTGWEDDIVNIAKNIVEEQSPKQLYIIRGKLQNLIEHDVSPDSIFKFLVGELKKHACEELQHRIDNLYDEYSRVDENLFESEKPLGFANNRYEEAGKRLHDPMRRNIVQQFLRIEEFIARFMSCYKSEQQKRAT